MKGNKVVAVSIGLGALALALAVGASMPAETEYRFDEVYSKVIIDTDAGSSQAETGNLAHGGDVVRTGWRGRATIAADSVASRFELYSGTRVRLASEKPGVIVLLERGRLKAMFDAVTGNDERIVETPGALLAVRGTRYGVEVDKSGDTILSVFEGMVEVRPFEEGMQPLLVRPGEVGRFGPKAEPRKVMDGMSERMWNESGGSRSMPGLKDSPDAKRPDGSTRPSREPSGMMGGSKNPPSSSGSKRPH